MGDKNIMTNLGEVRKTARIGKDFEKEIIQIQKERIKNGIDKKKTSIGKITQIIPRHKLWEKIKQDTIDYIFPKDKKGLVTIQIMAFILILLVAIVMLGVYVFVFNTITTYMSIDVDIGNVNLKDTTGSTLGQFNTGLLNNADNIGMAIIFGMILFMIMNGYFLGKNYHRLFIIVDIIIIIFSFILAIYVSQAYSTLINATPELSVYIDNLPKTSTFLLNLPIYVSIIGVLIMIFSYIIIPKNENEEQIYTNY